MPRRPPDDDSVERVGGLYDRFAGAMYRYAVMVLADPAAASDVVQKVFVSLLRRYPPPAEAGQHLRDGIERDEPYLRRAVRNECFTALRRRRRDAASIGQLPLLEPISPVDDIETRLTIEQLLHALSPEQREVVHLKVYEGMTFQEIADVIGENANTVASRYRYAMERMRAELGARR